MGVAESARKRGGRAIEAGRMVDSARPTSVNLSVAICSMELRDGAGRKELDEAGRSWTSMDSRV
jgi:methylthioribose-1-phosphate isomerase